ncbi:hypothetical protein AKJ61_00835 [candidate division MSBL1 archaeon SCGC-AAA259B11]|uniref:Poly A polymerase head domain-containing protein n=1 Tax=candidate division MSBL1 archaeon SCGC-AAA259B11 TaxID=1698260 RepID=A0A133U884_9EURY|nr:hypothetical protein AKJ61_00835 [candidate division MSBL1 archaeon SCGC-AAA259B11]
MPGIEDIETGGEYQGFKVYAVGGAVRDSIMGREVEDVDLLAIPENIENPIKALEGRMGYVDPSSTIPVFIDGQGREVALPRTEESTGKGYKDFEVSVLTRLFNLFGIFT